MSKAIYICKRTPLASRNEPDIIKKVCERITVDNSVPNPPTIVDLDGIYIGIFNPKNSILLNNNSLCLGNLLHDGTDSDWYRTKSPIPDGTFALFRSDSNSIEIATDNVASRTIWYYHANDLFIASTSQRMIITYLGSFMPNKKVYSWVLSSGSLGPELSWDKRIKQLTPDSKLILNRSTWKLTFEQNPIKYNIANLTYNEHFQRLNEALTDTFNQLHVDYTKWALPLSGGYDSRSILMFLGNQSKINAITWGLESSLKKKCSDAYVANLLAKYYNCKHKYYHTDVSKLESLEILFDRFLKIGEGRIDHISGYLDGFRIWNTLHNDGISGVIRGDEGFSGRPCRDERHARFRLGIPLLEDYANLKNKLNEMEIEPNIIPKYLLRQKNETIPLYRDRLYHQYRIPTILAALNDLKLSHVEIMNPLLSRKIIAVARTLPDELRAEKILFKNVVQSLSPNIEFAKYGSQTNFKDFFKNDQVMDVIKKELQSSTVLSDRLIRMILNGLSSSNRKKGRNIDFNILAYRAFIISKINKIYGEDANFLKYPI